MTSPDLIQVAYSRLAAGSAAIRNAVKAQQEQMETLYQAARKASALWDADSQRGFQERHDRVAARCADVMAMCTSHANLVDEHSATTAQIDSKAAAAFEGATAST